MLTGANPATVHLLPTRNLRTVARTILPLLLQNPVAVSHVVAVTLAPAVGRKLFELICEEVEDLSVHRSSRDQAHNLSVDRDHALELNGALLLNERTHSISREAVVGDVARLEVASTESILIAVLHQSQ